MALLLDGLLGSTSGQAASQSQIAGGGALLTPDQATIAAISIELFSIAVILVLLLSLGHEVALRRRKVLTIGLLAQLVSNAGELACWTCHGHPGMAAHLGLVAGSYVGSASKVVVGMAIVTYVYTDASAEPLHGLRTRPGLLALLGLYLLDLLLCLVNPICGPFFSIGETNTFQAGPLIAFYKVMMVAQPLALFAAVPRLRRMHGRGTALRLVVGGSLMLCALLTGVMTRGMFVTPSITLELLLLTVGVQLRLEDELAHARAEAAETHVRLLSGQIRPHFIFNALSAVKALIAEDPVLAESTLQDFADYLRSHLDVMSAAYLVPFDEEMDHVRRYVSLEATSSERDIELRCDCAAGDFSLPPLTIQPLVENAIRHGLRSCKEGGVIMVCTRETDDEIQISVTDNGCGFDPAAPGKGTDCHVGIANVRERLERQCRGTLSIESGPTGTKATITLPKESR